MGWVARWLVMVLTVAARHPQLHHTLRSGRTLLAAQAAVLLWAKDCLEGAKESEKEQLQEVRESSAAAGVPVVTVEDTKKLGEWVGVSAANVPLQDLMMNPACFDDLTRIVYIALPPQALS